MWGEEAATTDGLGGGQLLSSVANEPDEKMEELMCGNQKKVARHSTDIEPPSESEIQTFNLGKLVH